MCGHLSPAIGWRAPPMAPCAARPTGRRRTRDDQRRRVAVGGDDARRHGDRGDERHPEQRVLDREHVSAQRVVDIDLHRGVRAQLDHLARPPSRKPHTDHHRQLQAGPAELDDGGRVPTHRWPWRSGPSGDGRGRDAVGQERSGAGGGDEQQRGAQAGDLRGVACAAPCSSTSRVLMPNDHPVRGQPGKRGGHRRHRQHRAHAVQPTRWPPRRATDPWIARRVSSGPSTRARSAATAAARSPPGR